MSNMKRLFLITIFLCKMIYSAESHLFIDVVLDNDIILCDSTLYRVLKENGAWYPDILVAQSRLETGNYKSQLCVAANNIFGMRKVHKRETLQCGDTNGYGKYNHWIDSAIDRIMLDTTVFNNIMPSIEVYEKYITSYAKDSNYLKKIKSINVKK